jgi:hypothetical protein
MNPEGHSAKAKIAEAFERLDQLRVGRWYGGKGNGKVVEEIT